MSKAEEIKKAGDGLLPRKENEVNEWVIHTGTSRVLQEEIKKAWG
jgi:hypothetical protein